MLWEIVPKADLRMKFVIRMERFHKFDVTHIHREGETDTVLQSSQLTEQNISVYTG